MTHEKKVRFKKPCSKRTSIKILGIAGGALTIIVVFFFLFFGDRHIVKDIDGNVYKTVTIGDQEWFAENLRVTSYNNGDAIPTGLRKAGWENTTEGAYAIYPHTGGNQDHTQGINTPEEMVAAYGKLYNWFAVSDSRGLCPAGWSVPSDGDWKELEMYLGMSQAEANGSGFRGTNEGRKLKSERTATDSPNVGISTNDHPRWSHHAINFGLDEYGFSALPGGLRLFYGPFLDLGNRGYWWSASEGSSSYAWFRNLESWRAGVLRNDSRDKGHGFSVRCVRD